MERISKVKLYALRDLINKLMIESGQNGDYEINYAYQGFRLERKNGSVDVSPRLSTGQLFIWLHAFINGIEAVKGIGVK